MLKVFVFLFLAEDGKMAHSSLACEYGLREQDIYGAGFLLFIPKPTKQILIKFCVQGSSFPVSNMNKQRVQDELKRVFPNYTVNLIEENSN